MAEIQLPNVSKRWGGFTGGDNFNLKSLLQNPLETRFFRMKSTVLLGPSGCAEKPQPCA